MTDLDMRDSQYEDSCMFIADHARQWAARGASRTQWLSYAASLRHERNSPLAIPLSECWKRLPLIAAACFPD